MPNVDRDAPIMTCSCEMCGDHLEQIAKLRKALALLGNELDLTMNNKMEPSVIALPCFPDYENCPHQHDLTNCADCAVKCALKAAEGMT